MEKEEGITSLKGRGGMKAASMQASTSGPVAGQGGRMEKHMSSILPGSFMHYTIQPLQLIKHSLKTETLSVCALGSRKSWSQESNNPHPVR